jgi:signal transduction histidine kinase
LITLPEALPISLVLAVLVGLFVSVQRQFPSARVRLWTWAWALSFLHFFAKALESFPIRFETAVQAIDWGALELTGIVFLSSVMFAANERRRRLAFVTFFGGLTLAHTLCTGFNGAPWLSTGLMAAIFLGASICPLAITRNSARFYVAALLGGIGIGAVHEQMLGNWPVAISAILALSFGFSGVLFSRLHERSSLGVRMVTIGFVGWGMEYPFGAAFHFLLPRFQPHLDLWNVPRILVALGMILTLLEDRFTALERAQEQIRSEGRLLERLSRITSRLLSGKEPVGLCGEIASAITETSSFTRAAVFLLGEDRRFYLAGSRGFTAQEEETLRAHSGGYLMEALKQRSAEGAAGSRSLRMAEGGNLVLVPMVSWRGSSVGCLYLSGGKNEAGADSPEMMRLEVFASDLAVTFENVKLHQQLVRSEKLAGLGQLVAGVAHELNNPLTGVIGYTELLLEEVRGGPAVARVERLGNEARRMQRIVDGLLRFGRQNHPALHSANLANALKDVVQLREYHLRAYGIDVDMQIEPGLPPLGIGEDELKQVLLNILNNAIDAVQESAKRKIKIRLSHHTARIRVQFEDSGPGFTDLGRAFDPFYTTKPAGKGTGLGLSICYGIVQECGGEITVENNEPYGAKVVIDLPVAAPQAVVAETHGGSEAVVPLLSKRAI